MGQAAAKESLHTCKNLVSTCTGEVSVRETAARRFKYHGDEDGTDWENKMAQLVERMESVALQREPDEEFPEEECMLGDMSDQGWMVHWVPAEMAPALNKIPATEVTLYQHMSTKGIADGCGHAWLVAAIAAIADYPEVIIGCFPEQLSNQLNSGGTYTIRLFNPRDNSAETRQTINDVIPLAGMSRSGTDCDDWTPLYIRPGRELFACLIEKACAKMLGAAPSVQDRAHDEEDKPVKLHAGLGGYAELEHGTALFAWAMLVGFEPGTAFSISKHLPSRPDEWWELEVTDLSAQDFYTGEQTNAGSGEDGALSTDELFDRLSEVVWPNGYVVGASVQNGDVDGENPALGSGLVAGHVYGVRRLIKDGALKLVQLRDPWVTRPGGKKSGWIGSWGSGHASWSSPEGERIVKNNSLSLQEGDGQGYFWMSWEDFCDTFDNVQFAKVK